MICVNMINTELAPQPTLSDLQFWVITMDFHLMWDEMIADDCRVYGWIIFRNGSTLRIPHAKQCRPISCNDFFSKLSNFRRRYKSGRPQFPQILLLLEELVVDALFIFLFDVFGFSVFFLSYLLFRLIEGGLLGI